MDDGLRAPEYPLFLGIQMKPNRLYSYACSGGLLALLAAPVLAQGVAPEGGDVTWRAANDAVGQFRRGHADVLKWEQAQPMPVAEPQPAANGLALMSGEQVVRLAWRAHPDLARPLARLGARNEALMAQGQWLDVDSALARQVEGFEEVVSVAAQARKAWTELVASRQVVRQMESMADAADAAEALGAKMVAVGNWSKLQHAQVQLAKFKAQAALKKARHTAFTAQARLIKTLQLTGVQTHVNVPLQWPALPERAVSPPEFQQRLTQIHAQLTRVNAIVGRGRAEQAFAAYQTSFELARSAGGEVLGAQTLIHEETVLHYNGMLKSTWELLATAQNLHQARVDAITALRDFELAQIDLQWVLLGGEPDALVSWNAAAGEAASTAGH